MVGGAAAAVFGLYYLTRGQAAVGAQVELALTPVPVTAGEASSVESYRIIAKRRSGMTYDAASGTPGSTINFVPSISGLFTRNFVMEGDSLWAEVSSS